MKMYSQIIYLCLFFLLVNAEIVRSKKSLVETLNEDNWDRMLSGEWMVEFYAPWCPACKSLEPIWEGLAFRKEELGIDVGKVDVTDAPGLSGRFMVTALPTIYHVKDGVFRQYKSPRDQDSLIDFVSERTWQKIEPIPNWKSPTSIQMSVISQVFRMAQILRGVHNKLMEDFGLPTWGSYLIFALATIVLGAVIGLVLVCLIDLIYPPKPHTQSSEKLKDGFGDSTHERSSGDDDVVKNVEDDLVDEEESESEKSEGGDKSKSKTSSPNVRKRKPRKAD